MKIKKLIKLYGIVGFINLIIDTFFSRIIFCGVRIIRRPFYIKGKNKIVFGENFTAGVGLRLEVFSENNNIAIKIGKNVQVNDYVHIGAIDSITIGDNVLIASKVFISDHNHGYYSGAAEHSNPNVPPNARPLSKAPVLIEENVWIGEYVAILSGVTIGKGSIIGCMSVVSRDIPPFSIAVGSPAKVIKKFNFNNKKWERV